MRKDIEMNENFYIPDVQTKLINKEKEIDENYSKDWQDNVGEDIYGKESLKKTASKIQESFMHMIKITESKIEKIKTELEDQRSNYNTKYQLSYNIHDGSNKEFTQELKQLKEIALPEYLEKIEDSRKKANQI